MRKWRSFPEDPPEEPLVNLTPLIDVVFVVLISFLLIAPILDVDLVDLASSSQGKTHAHPSESSPLTIVVQKDNSLWVKGKRCSLAELEQSLLRQKALYPHLHPQLFQDQGATFGTYQAVKNVLERCGFDQLDVVLKPS